MDDLGVPQILGNLHMKNPRFPEKARCSTCLVEGSDGFSFLALLSSHDVAAWLFGHGRTALVYPAFKCPVFSTCNRRMICSLVSNSMQCQL